MIYQKYLQLVQSSPAFNDFDEEMKKSVLDARGERMELYAKIFNDSQNLLQKAQDEFAKRNTEISDGLVIEVKNIQRKKVSDAEKYGSAEDEKVQGDLLQQINKL